MSTPIKPCPFCGADAQVGGYAGKWVCCVDSECAVSGPSRHTVEQAITAWNAAPRAPSAPPANTVRVRVAVSVSEDGMWAACGGSMLDDGEVHDICQHEPGDRLTWLTANVPLPEPAAEVEATIE